MSASEETVLPPSDTGALTEVEEMLGEGDGELRLTFATSSVELPAELRAVLATVVSAMRRGQAVTLAPLAMRLTTQQAADLLGISRPTLVKLLEDGRIPYETPNRHRRIRLVDLLSFQEARRKERREALGHMATEAQDAGTYDQPAGSYEAALDEARQKLA
ncbi:MAG: helix-turn-helix domain-containing protein [Acidimicrobiales bacterium]